MRGAALLVAGLVGSVVLASPARAQLFRTPPGAEIVRNSVTVLDELTSVPLKGIPGSLLASAQGVIICPNVIKVGFVVGGRHGSGVLLVKRADGTWSRPVILNLSGGSVGWQAGVQATDVVLVLKTQRSVDGVLAGRKITLGADASIAAGPLGREGAAATDATLQSEIYSYSRSRGLFAGVALNGSSLMIDPAANGAYYQRPGIGAADIIEGGDLPVSPEAEALREALVRHAQANSANTASTATVPAATQQ